jgi:ankyrin repeat protein
MSLHFLVKTGNSGPIKQIIETARERTYQLVNERDSNGQTPIHIASMSGHLELLMLLKSKRGSLTARDNCGRTAIAWASLRGHTEIVRYLLSQPRVDPTIPDFSKNDTPLHFASSQGHFEVIKVLCEALVVNVNVRNKLGMTPLAQAAWSGRVSLVKYLRDFGADVNTTDLKGDTPLHYAVQLSHHYLIECLVMEGASILKRNFEDNSPLDLSRSDDIRELLIKTKRKIPSLQESCFKAIRRYRLSQKDLLVLPPQLRSKLLNVDLSS